jgi:mRNA interferase MazF
MNVTRGDVVLVDFPFSQGGRSKVRPALVVQNNLDNARLLNTIVTQITGNVQRAGETTQVLVEISTPDGKQSGLQFDSVVNCLNLATIDKNHVLRRLGSLSAALMQIVNDALKSALELT